MTSSDIQPARQFRVSIKALITNDQGDLLLLGKVGNWQLPGGGLEHGEQIEEAVRREVQEELGVTASTVATHPSYTWTKEISPNYWMLILTYKVELTSTEFTLEEGLESAKFFTKEELAQLDFPSGQQLALDQTHLANIINSL